MDNSLIQRIEDQDYQEYHGLELISGIKVVLISDPTTDKSSAVLVNIDSFVRLSKYSWLKSLF